MKIVPDFVFERGRERGRKEEKKASILFSLGATAGDPFSFPMCEM